MAARVRIPFGVHLFTQVSAQFWCSELRIILEPMPSYSLPPTLPIVPGAVSRALGGIRERHDVGSGRGGRATRRAKARMSRPCACSRNGSVSQRLRFPDCFVGATQCEDSFDAPLAGDCRSLRDADDERTSSSASSRRARSALSRPGVRFSDCSSSTPPTSRPKRWTSIARGSTASRFPGAAVRIVSAPRIARSRYPLSQVPAGRAGPSPAPPGLVRFKSVPGRQGRPGRSRRWDSNGDEHQRHRCLHLHCAAPLLFFP